MAPPSSLSLRWLSIVVSGEGALGALKSYKDNGAPLSVIKIVKYCGVWVGGGIARRQNPTKDNGAPSLCH